MAWVVRRAGFWWLALPLALAGVSSGLAAQDVLPAPAPVGPRYVSMGSSFAAGPGVTVSADVPANRCARSADNYARQLARRRHYVLVDVACSGATTEHVLGPWNELAPQIEAVTPDTALVTVTVGGNDVSFVRDLIAFACAAGPQPPVGAPGGKCPTVAVPAEADWRALAVALDRMAGEVRRRAPRAQLVFVQYVQMVPLRGSCAAVPISPVGLATVRAIQGRLLKVTARVARQWHARIVDPREPGAAHDPCSAAPWASGFPDGKGAPFVPFHPNLSGMTAIADRLDRIVHP